MMEDSLKVIRCGCHVKLKIVKYMVMDLLLSPGLVEELNLTLGLQSRFSKVLSSLRDNRHLDLHVIVANERSFLYFLRLYFFGDCWNNIGSFGLFL